MSEEKSRVNQEDILNAASDLIALAKARGWTPEKLVNAINSLDERSAEQVAYTLTGNPNPKIVKDVAKILKPSES